MQDPVSRNWRPAAPIPNVSPRFYAAFLAGGGVLMACLDVWARVREFPIHASLGGYLIVGFWLVRMFDKISGFALAGWWISVFWHVPLLVSVVAVSPFALALAHTRSWIVLLPLGWVPIGFFLSVAGLCAEQRLRRASR